MLGQNRQLVIALAISLGLNLFLGGFLVARSPWRSHVEHGDRRHSGPPRDPPGEAGHAADLPLEGRLFSRMLRDRPELKAPREVLRHTRQELFQVLESESLDPAILSAALEQLRTQNLETQKAVHAALVEVATALPPAERLELVRGERRRHRDGFKREPR